MNLIKNLYGFIILCGLCSTAILAVLIDYPGSVSVEIQPFSARVTIKSESASECIIDPILPIGNSHAEG